MTTKGVISDNYKILILVVGNSQAISPPKFNNFNFLHI